MNNKDLLLVYIAELNYRINNIEVEKVKHKKVSLYIKKNIEYFLIKVIGISIGIYTIKVMIEQLLLYARV
jgi:hypothetical protein